MKRHRLRPLAATFRRLRRHPFTEQEVRRLWTTLEVIEGEVEQLGAIARQERADVTWVERPLVRAYLWVTGELKHREARERAEADAALSATMQRGEQARQLRSWLEALPRDRRRLPNARVAGDLERLEAIDLAAYAEDGPELYALWNRAQRARELTAIAGLAKQISVRVGLGGKSKRHNPGHRGSLSRLRRKLLAVERSDLADALSPLPPSVYGTRQALKIIRKALSEQVTVLRRGLAKELAEIVRDHVRRAVPVLDTIDINAHQPS